MTALLITLSLILIAIVAVQIGKVTELASKIRGEEEMQEIANNRAGLFSMVFMVLFLIGVFASGYYYKNYMLGYGPHAAASEHGGSLDSLFHITLLCTGFVFVLTQIALFYFAYKYRAKRGSKAVFLPHNNLVEYIWTGIPAIVMTYLVIGGLDAWNEVMADIKPGEEHIEIEATGYQFAWELRYPGPDGLIGEKDFRLIDPATNPLGQNWEDKKNIDDIHVNEIVLPKGKKVRVRITAKDVLHNFYLPHFRVKMDAIPGLPTYFVFTPSKTTEEYRQELRKYPEYQQPDPEQPDLQLWETFNFELACAELCGRGHYSMKKLVRIVEEDEYEDWLSSQSSYYLSNVRGKDYDPLKDEILDFEVEERKEEFNEAVQGVLQMDSPQDTSLRFNYVFFETGSANLTDLSRYELDNLYDLMTTNSSMTVELAGHTDNSGDASSNVELSQKRAAAVYQYLADKGIDESRLRYVGYGSARPVDTNETEEGRAMNRRTEFRILTK